MKKITFILTSMLFLLVGGVFSQEVTTLYLNGGQNWNATDGANNWGSYSGSSVTYTAGDVTINQFGRNLGMTGLTGSNWCAPFTEGEIHTFKIELDEAPGHNHFELVGGTKVYDSFESSTDLIVSVIGETDTEATLVLNHSYDGVYLLNNTKSGETIKIKSITRTITTASSVASPTISPASGTYDGDLTVTITKGEGNEKVVYSVSGATTGNETGAEFTTASKTLTLTGTGTITVTAKGVVGSDESSEVTNTYTYDSNIPSGIVTAWSGPQQFSSWDDKAYLNHDNFSSLEIGDYIYLNCSSVDADNRIGFRTSSFDNSPFDSYDALYMPITDGISKLKITDATIRDAFKNDNPVIQGYTFTLDNVQIHKHVDIGEGANTISKSTDMIVNLDRSFVAGTWNTVCLPFVPTPAQANELFGSGYQLAAFTGVSGTTMQFTTINIAAFEAGKPYLVMPKEGCATGTTVLFDVNITAKNPTPVTKGDYTFTGTFTTRTFSGDECNTSRFVATGNELQKPTNNSTLKSLRCYFTVPVATARSLSFDVDEEGGTTSINTVQGSGVMVNGYYNLAGQRVAKPTKGLYIVNGKKVVIK